MNSSGSAGATPISTSNWPRSAMRCGLFVVVAAHEERFVFRGAAEGACGEELPQVDAEQLPQLGAQGGVVGLEDDPLHLLLEGAADQHQQTAHAELAEIGIGAEGAGGGEPDAVALPQVDVDAQRMQLVVLRRRDRLAHVQYLGGDHVRRPVRYPERVLDLRDDARRSGRGRQRHARVTQVVLPDDNQPRMVGRRIGRLKARAPAQDAPLRETGRHVEQNHEGADLVRQSPPPASEAW